MNLLVFLSALLASAAGAQVSLTQPVFTEEFSTFVQSTMQAFNVSGLSIGVLRPDGQAEYGSWGNRTEEGDPVTPATVFNIGSCSKAFLPAALGILMQDFERGKNKTALPRKVSTFNWDTKIQDLLPEEWLVEDTFTTQKASLKDLLSHQTGFAELDLAYSATATPRDIVLKLRHLRASYEFREAVRIHQSYVFHRRACRIKILWSVLPRFCGDTNPEASRDVRINIISRQGVQRREHVTIMDARRKKNTIFPARKLCRLLAGPGGVMSTAEDMLKWVKLHLNGGVDVASNTTIIPPATFDLATSALAVLTPKGSVTDSIWTYGFGWVRQSYRGHEAVKHNGGAPGVASWTTFYPHDNFGLFVVENTGTPLPDILERAVADRVLNLTIADVTLPDRPPKQPSLCAPSSRSHLLCLNMPEHTRVPDSELYHLTVLDDFRLLTGSLEIFLRRGRKNYMPPGPGFGAPHLRFIHDSGDCFAFESTNPYPTATVPNKNTFCESPFQLHSSFLVEKGKVAGFGFYVSLINHGRSKKGGSVRDTADVWFDKVA
ncbi:beta-lactamase/transpeptidase-like protein [Mycena rebaudengoi]|nr:beta-lactamase/transpeptidase-like protein [Mycena rebaudengoi]